MTKAKKTTTKMYHYTESGLNYVWLANGYRLHMTPHGKGVAIDDVEGLNRCIAKHIIHNRPYMSGAEFRFLRKELDMSQATLSAAIGKDVQSVARWEKHGRVPKMADRFLRIIFQSYTNGNEEVKDLVERLNDLDQQTYERMQLTRTRSNWTALAA
jgi:DNA-binding transcriptional regulator YiaG